MKTYTLDDIRRCGPCYDPEEIVPKDWTGTLLDILDFTPCRQVDRIWVFLSLLPGRQAMAAALMLLRETTLYDGRKVADLLTDPRAIALLEQLDFAVKQKQSVFSSLTEAIFNNSDLGAEIAEKTAFDGWGNVVDKYVLSSLWSLCDSAYDSAIWIASAVCVYASLAFQYPIITTIREEQIKLLRAFVENSQEEEDVKETARDQRGLPPAILSLHGRPEVLP